MISSDEIDQVQRDMIRNFLRKFTKDDDFRLFLDEFEQECKRRGIMDLPAESYDTDTVGSNLARLLAVFAYLDFDMRMWDMILAWKELKEEQREIESGDKFDYAK